MESVILNLVPPDVDIPKLDWLKDPATLLAPGFIANGTELFSSSLLD